MLGRVKQTMQRRGAADEPWSHLRGAGVLLACSGGRDSTALVAVMQLLAHGLQLRLTIGHVDHGLRPESVAEAEHVERMARELELPVRVIRLIGSPRALEPGPGLPARARAVRRAALRELAHEVGARWVALGHTATDQLETVLMHLVRGAGLDGLAAMPAVDEPWLRPLLGVTREETRQLCERMRLAFVDDPTNLDAAHFRVRIREHVLPILRRENPQVERTLATTSEQVRDADDALERWTAREELARRLGPTQRASTEGQAWSTAGLEDLPRAIRTRLLRRICLARGVDRQALKYAVIADIDRAVLARARARADHGDALAPREWALRPRTLVRLDRSGLWVGPAPQPLTG